MATYRRQQSGSLGAETACPSCTPTVYSYRMQVCGSSTIVYVDRVNAFNNTNSVTIQSGSAFHNLSLNQVVLVKQTANGTAVCATNLGTSTTTATYKMNISAGPFSACSSCFTP